MALESIPCPESVGLAVELGELELLDVLDDVVVAEDEDADDVELPNELVLLSITQTLLLHVYPNGQHRLPQVGRVSPSFVLCMAPPGDCVTFIVLVSHTMGCICEQS